MSWRPFKSSRKSGTAISRTAEREFEREVKKLIQLDEATKKVYKDTKKCTDAIAAQSKSEAKMASDLQQSQLSQNDDQLHQFTEAWQSAVSKLEQQSHVVNSEAHKVLSEPMKKFSSIFPSVQSSLKKREQSLQEYEKCQAKVDKYQGRERTGPNIVKLDSARKALHAAREDFSGVDKGLREDLPRLYEGRIEYIQPSFQALIRSQIGYYTEAHKTYAELSEKLNGKDELLSDQEFEKKLKQKLTEMRALSITTD